MHFPQHVFCALTCVLGLMTPLVLCIFYVRTTIKTATNVDSSLTVLTTLAMSLARVTFCIPGAPGVKILDGLAFLVSCLCAEKY